MDLIVATEEGDVYTIGTMAPYDPMSKWTSPNHGRNVWTFVGPDTQGVRFADVTRNKDHAAGEYFNVEFDIFDNRDRSKFSPPIARLAYSIEVLFHNHLHLVSSTLFLMRFSFICRSSLEGSGSSLARTRRLDRTAKRSRCRPSLSPDSSASA